MSVPASSIGPVGGIATTTSLAWMASVAVVKTAGSICTFPFCRSHEPATPALIRGSSITNHVESTSSGAALALNWRRVTLPAEAVPSACTL